MLQTAVSTHGSGWPSPPPPTCWTSWSPCSARQPPRRRTAPSRQQGSYFSKQYVPLSILPPLNTDKFPSTSELSLEERCPACRRSAPWTGTWPLSSTRMVTSTLTPTTGDLQHDEKHLCVYQTIMLNILNLIICLSTESTKYIHKFALLWGEAQKKITYCYPKVT